MGIWSMVKDQIIESRGIEMADKIIPAERAKELDAAIDAYLFSQLTDAQYREELGLHELQKLLEGPGKPTGQTGAKS